MSHQANHAPRVTPPIAHATCRNPDHTRVVYFRTAVTRKTEALTPYMLCPHTASAMNRQLWPRQVLSAPGAEIPTRNSYFDKTENQQFRIRDPPQTTKF